MIFLDTLDSASSPRELFDELLARCVRASCVTEITNIKSGVSWRQFMKLHAAALTKIKGVSQLIVPCLTMPSFVLRHLDDPEDDTKYAVFSLPRNQSFVIVSSSMSWKCFGRGSDELSLMIQCTPSPSFSMASPFDPYSFAYSDLLNQYALTQAWTQS